MDRLPILAMPFGPPLAVFLAEHKPIMYSQPQEGAPEATRRVLARYRPLAYQWALHLLSGLSFVHARSIVLGNLRAETCWLSRPDLALFLVGALDAGFRVAAAAGTLYEGGSWRDEPFHPLHEPRLQAVVPTVQTGLFLWACLFYGFMTGVGPGNGIGRSRADIQQMLRIRQWPALEGEYQGQLGRRY